ncbi:LAFE_0E04720g1_1 [Lachancea fermentati]|uniref:Small ribosomal subunit protein uS10m n=1 Tax=Lachancea fermentati TaxID=4955 RepID=A0A1G4MCR6_LACFM|nr:LAFE_0E04720g1_1 [Lachancea fermentati]
MLRRSSSLPFRQFLKYHTTTVAKEATPAANKLPINVEAVYHAPLRVPIEHGDLIADLQLRSYDHENLDFFSDFILRAGFYLGMPLTGPKPLPTRRERWTVIRSPFAQAKSKENFERHTHKRLIRVWDTNPEVVELWLSYITKHSIPGVGMKCNLYQREGIKLSSAVNHTSLVNTGEKSKTLDEAVGEKVMELLEDEAFKKHM